MFSSPREKHIFSSLLSSFTGLEAKFTTIYTYLNELKKESHFPIVALKQAHGNIVKIVEDIEPILSPSQYIQIGEGDALITQKLGLRLSIRSADCVPILMYDAKQKVLAAVHSGWRSTLKSIAPKTLKIMHKRFGTDFKDLFVSLGPAICHNCFEVGDDVMGLFQKKIINNMDNSCLYSKKGEKYYIDLKAIINAQLIGCSIPPSQIERLNQCTRCGDLFPSYRGGDKKKRMYAVISLKQ